MLVEWENRAKEIIALHNGIETAYRRSVQDAVKIGELLLIQKQQMEYGQYLLWVKEKLPFSEATAKRYVQLFEYRDKTLTVSDLQTAYEVVKELESEKRHQDQERKQDLISTYLKTGEKPEGWDRSCDYELQRRKDDATALSEANQDVEINEAEPIENEVLLDYKDVIDEEYEQTQKEKAHQKARRGLLGQIDDYLKTYPDDLGYLEAHLLDKKMQLPHPRTDAEIEKIMENFAY